MRLALIFGALATMTAAAIVVGWIVFQTIAANMAVLSEERLPELRSSADVVTEAARIRDVLSEILMAESFESLIMLDGQTRAVLDDLNVSIDGIGSENAQAFSESVGQVDTALFALMAARMDQLTRANSMVAGVEDTLTLSTQASALLDQATDDAYFDLVMGSETTIETIDTTLSQLIQRDFALYQVTLQTRAEVNLLTGLALSVLQARDPAMLSILSDLAETAKNQLAELMPLLATNEATAELSALVEQTRPELDRAFSRTGERTPPERILSIRQQIDAALSASLDDIYFQLVVNTDDAKTSNEDSIRHLMDDQVTRIKLQAALDANTKAFFASVMQTALARDANELAASRDTLMATAKKVRDAMADAAPEIIAKLEEMLEMANPETGIAATRLAAFSAQSEAVAAARSAAEAVQKISTEINAFASEAQNKIDNTAAALNAEVAQARVRMQQIGLASVALVVLTPPLIWMMVTHPLNKVTAVTERLAQGDLSEIEAVGALRGEIGRMARALEVFRDRALERIELQKEDQRRQAEMRETERAAADAQRVAKERERTAEIDRTRQEQERDAQEQARNEAQRASAEAERKARADEQQAVVDTLAQSLQRLSTGDLAHTIDTEFPGTYEALRQDYNAAVTTLADLIRRMNDSAGSIDASSAEIASSSLELSRRTENSAASLEETAAALSELASSVSSAARGATEASTTVGTVKDDAEVSQKVMQDAVGAMSEIEQSAARIADIVEVIDSIAFQTNLLALNAGVEAARAGEAGRGFAVVASEVRILAHRCSEAALQINSLISDSTRQVENGVTLIDKTSVALETILAGITKVSQNVSEIANSASEQSSGIAEINVAMEQLDQSTQQNAAMFETTTAASQALTGEAGKLARLVSGFTVQETAHAVESDRDASFEQAS